MERYVLRQYPLQSESRSEIDRPGWKCESYQEYASDVSISVTLQQYEEEDHLIKNWNGNPRCRLCEAKERVDVSNIQEEAESKAEVSLIQINFNHYKAA